MQFQSDENLCYKVQIGKIFKDTLVISNQGIELNGNFVDIHEISGIRWGGETTSINGIFNVTKYVISYQTKNDKTYTLFPNKKVYGEVTEHLWRTVGMYILIDMLNRLKKGEMINIGNISFNDAGINLDKPGWFSSERKFFTWSHPLTMYSENGELHIKTQDKQYEISGTYLQNMNLNIFEILLRNFFENFDSSNPKLSSLLH